MLPPRRLPCANCKGIGIKVERFGEFGERGKDYVTCHRCEGTGTVIDPRDRPKAIPRPKKRRWFR